MQRIPLSIAIGGVCIAILTGCRNPPPPPAPIPSSENRDMARRSDPVKPLPPPRDYQGSGPGFNDVALVNQRPPEQAAFVDAYNHVGRPKIVVFVNRTFDGDIIPVNDPTPIASVEHTKSTDTGVKVEDTTVQTRDYGYRQDTREEKSGFESTGPAKYREKTEVYLRPGQYDEVQAKQLDYQAMENILSDWIAANGQVELMSPNMVRQRLTDAQIKELESGRPRVLSEMAQALQTDVLIQVQSRPTRQTQQGLEVRVTAEAINTRGGQSIGRAVVDIPPPLEKRQLNEYTRFLARKLMDDMTQTWKNAAMPLPPPGAPTNIDPRPPENRPPLLPETNGQQQGGAIAPRAQVQPPVAPPERELPPRQLPPEERSMPPIERQLPPRSPEGAAPPDNQPPATAPATTQAEDAGTAPTTAPTNPSVP